MIETRQILEELNLKNVLATSSTGAVFEAGDPGTGRDVVIKMVSCAVPNAEEEVRRVFLEMAEAARSTDVPAMPTLTDHGLTPEGDGFVVMDLVEGQTLDALDELSAFASINVLLDVLSCVEDLAKAGSAHLNLKPANIFVVNAPANDRAKVLGFGTSATILHAGAGVPVPADDPHRAPELVHGEPLPSDQAWRSDLFSLGIIACGLLGAEIEADGYERPKVKLPAGVREALPEAEPLEDILGQMMEPDPMLRGESADVVRDPLIRALPDPPAMEPRETLSDTVLSVEGFDPNKTDPAFQPPPVAAAEPEIPLPPPSNVMEPDATVIATHEAGDGWPEVLFDDPVLPASLSDPEDTDVRNPIPGDVWVPSPEGADDPDAEPTAVAVKKARVAGGRRVSRVELAVVAAVVVVLGSIIAFTWPSNGDDRGLVAAPATQLEQGNDDGLVPPPPDQNLFDDLLAVQQLVDDGDLVAARTALGALEDREGLSFSSDESALYDSLVTAVAQAADKNAAVEDLRTGLAYGSVKMVRRGVAGLAGFSAADFTDIDGLPGDLDRARKILRLHADMWEAQQEGDHLGAIEYALRLEADLPRYSGAPEIREQSAVALEARAEALIADDQFANAKAVLESMRRVWPDRDGAAARIAWCDEQIDLAQRDGAVIMQALAKGEAGDPEAGLAVLDSLTPEPMSREDYDRARLELQNRLAEMDAGDPTIEFASAQELRFKKNTTITVPLRVTDDYRVERVVVHARNEADDGYLQIPLHPNGDGLYDFTVDPELHGNKDVYFFVVAQDHSGHIASLGTEEDPRLVVRKKWFKKRS